MKNYVKLPAFLISFTKILSWGTEVINRKPSFLYVLLLLSSQVEVSASKKLDSDPLGLQPDAGSGSCPLSLGYSSFIQDSLYLSQNQDQITIYDFFYIHAQNIDTISDASIIGIGENHDCTSHHDLEKYVSNVFGRKDDWLLIEGTHYRSLVCESFLPGLNPQLKCGGWEKDKEGFSKILEKNSSYQQMTAKLSQQLELLLKKKEAVLEKMKNFNDKNIFTKFFIDFFYNYLEEVMKDLETINREIQFLNDNFPKTLQEFKKFQEETLLKYRNNFLKELLKEHKVAKNRVIFFAGRKHLIKVSDKPDFSYGKSDIRYELREYLDKQKSIILIPKYCG